VTQLCLTTYNFPSLTHTTVMTHFLESSCKFQSILKLDAPALIVRNNIYLHLYGAVPSRGYGRLLTCRARAQLAVFISKGGNCYTTALHPLHRSCLTAIINEKKISSEFWSKPFGRQTKVLAFEASLLRTFQ